jgi:hypothetical protein
LSFEDRRSLFQFIELAVVISPVVLWFLTEGIGVIGFDRDRPVEVNSAKSGFLFEKL